MVKSHQEERHESAYGYEWKQQECKRQSLFPEDTIPVDFAKHVGIVAALQSLKRTQMSFELEFIQKPSYLHAIVIGTNTEENIFAYVEEITKECSKRKCTRLLVEERLQGPQLTVFHVYRIIEKISHDLSGLYNAVAYVDVYQEVNLMEFGETVATNRGFPIKVFLDVQDAEKWLLET